MLLTCALLRFDYSSYYENIKQYVAFINKNSDMVSWKWAYVKSEKRNLGLGCQLGGALAPLASLICWLCFLTGHKCYLGYKAAKRRLRSKCDCNLSENQRIVWRLRNYLHIGEISLDRRSFWSHKYLQTEEV